MKRNNCIFPLIVYCLDKESMIALKEYPNVRCISASSFMRYEMNKNLSIWNTIDYKRIVFSKLDAIKYTLELPQYADYYIGYIDTDIILFKDPTKVMMKALKDNPEALVISQCDENRIQCSNIKFCPNICSGVIVFRQSFILKSLLGYSERDIIVNLSDQEYLCKQLKKFNIHYMTIDRNIFMNGSFPGVRLYEKSLILPKEAVLLHYNFMIGGEKEECMKKNDMWYIGV